ncbi:MULTISPECIES: hypothetical protein [unclassified Rhodococcus (in: high G+C Gram-positive bacteria)]|uniref:hypothetical protein n=1 Tax=unclassified Rhodococcus (in: high G+C Gram-positive bacteria) TaxID=192944 RepID=UPI001FF72865|nr:MULTISPECIES: hypothetical protein [unclassified Rhodococcus (in: high G+C Gram-positive bacteria)]
MTLSERVEHLRRRMASVPARGETRSVRQPIEPVIRPRVEPASSVPRAVDPVRSKADPVRSKAVLAVPPALATMLPYGGLARGSVAAVSGAGSLLLGMVAAVTASGGHVAVVGQPRFGLLAAVEMGAELRRLAVVPDPGEDPVEVAAILLDGLDLVVLGLGGRSVPPSRARAVVARARSKGSTLLVTDGHWDGVELRLDAEVRSYNGFGTGVRSGRGRLRNLQLEVRAQGKAMRPRSTCFDLRLERGRIEWSVAAQVDSTTVNGSAEADLAVLA